MVLLITKKRTAKRIPTVKWLVLQQANKVIQGDNAVKTARVKVLTGPLIGVILYKRGPTWRFKIPSWNRPFPIPILSAHKAMKKCQELDMIQNQSQSSMSQGKEPENQTSQWEANGSLSYQREWKGKIINSTKHDSLSSWETSNELTVKQIPMSQENSLTVRQSHSQNTNLTKNKFSILNYSNYISLTNISLLLNP